MTNKFPKEIWVALVEDGGTEPYFLLDEDLDNMPEGRTARYRFIEEGTVELNVAFLPKGKK